MELDITEFFNAAEPYTYSHSQAEGGPYAGPHTWQAAKDADFQIIATDGQRHAFRVFAANAGGWDDDEIAAWTGNELNALCIQWVSGDMREPVGFELGPNSTDAQWQDYERQCEIGNCAGRLFRGDDGRVYWSMD